MVLSSTANTLLNAPQSPQTIVYEEAVANGLNPKIFSAIATCESEMREFDKEGNALRGVINPMDVGIFQINEKYHLDESRSLGFNIYTVSGNVGFAAWLASQEGYTPWLASSACWNKLSLV